MQIKPIKTEYKIEYPPANEVKDIQKILNNRKPKRWKRNLAIGATVTSISLGSLVYNNDTGTSKLLAQQMTNTSQINYDIGETACIAVTPPVYVTESEVKEIICSGFQKAGIEVDTLGKFEKDIYFENCAVKETKGKPIIFNDSLVKHKIDFIAIDKQNKIGVLYLDQNSTENYFYICDFDISKGLTYTKNQIISHITNKMDSVLKSNNLKGIYIFDPKFLNILEDVDGNPKPRKYIKESKDEMKASIKEQINDQLKKIKG